MALRLKHTMAFRELIVQVSKQCGYVRLPACVNSKQRAILHVLAEEHGLEHTSCGDGQARQLLLGDPQQPIQVLFMFRLLVFCIISGARLHDCCCRP